MDITQDEYYAIWKKYKNGRRNVFFLIVSFYPLAFFVILPLSNYYLNDWIIHAFVLVWFAAFLFFFWRGFTLICPRCHKYFEPKRHGYIIGYKGFSDKRCMNCGLEKWMLSDLTTKYLGA